MSKMIKCKTCNEEIAANAKTCPKCGAKNKKPIYKKIWFWILIVIIIIAIVPKEEEQNNNSNSTNNQQEETVITYTKTDVDTLMDELSNNAASAQEKYKGQYLEIKGRLGVIDSDLKYIGLYSIYDEWDLTGIHCTIKNDATREIVKTLSKNQTITVKGKITDVGEVLGYYLNIDEIITQ